MLPEGWKKVGLLEVTSITSGQVNPLDEKYSDHILLAPNHIESGTGRIICFESAKQQSAVSGKYLVKPGQVVYSKIRPYLKKAAIAHSEMLCSADMYPFTVSDEIDAGYLLNVLLSHHFTAFAVSASGRTGIPKINREELAEYVITLPPLPEQQKIAKILSTWDEAIEKKKSLVDKKNEVKKYFIDSIFGSDRCLNGDLKKEYLLDSLFVQRTERGSKGDLLSVTRDRGVISQTESEKKDTSNADKAKYLKIYPNDIVYNTMRMWQGVSAVSKLEGLVSPAYTVCFLQNNNFNITYFGYFFKNKKIIHQFHRRSQGLVDDTLNLKYENFKKISINVHPIEQQQKIADFFADMDLEISLLTKQVLALQRQKNGLMQALLTGKKRVKVV